MTADGYFFGAQRGKFGLKWPKMAKFGFSYNYFFIIIAKKEI